MKAISKFSFLSLLSIFIFGPAQAQFAPAAGLPGTTAIDKDSSILRAWATGCVIQRGWQNIADTALGLATIGTEAAAIGKAGGNGVVSLGDGGVATLTFASPITNGAGFDFAVFENGFTTSGPGMAFLEFAFVEVSSDGINFVRFPVTSNIQDTVQMAMAGTDCSLVNNLAGKYVSNYGTPFDLEELKDTPGLNVNSITHVRIIDVVGSINPVYATYDKNGHIVNDPYPTAFASGGFDLDAVGAMYVLNTGIDEAAQAEVKVFPNPAKDVLNFDARAIGGEARATIFDAMGAAVAQWPTANVRSAINISGLSKGLYFLQLKSHAQTAIAKFMVE